MAISQLPTGPFSCIQSGSCFTCVTHIALFSPQTNGMTYMPPSNMPLLQPALVQSHPCEVCLHGSWTHKQETGFGQSSRAAFYPGKSRLVARLHLPSSLPISHQGADTTWHDPTFAPGQTR